MASRRLSLIALLALSPSLAVRADPSPVYRTFQVQAVITNGCAFGTRLSANSYDLGLLDFGTLGSLDSPVDVSSGSGAGSIVLTCTPGMTVSVAIDQGLNGSGSQRYLKLASGSDRLAYQLYQDPARSRVWGNGAQARAIANFPPVTQTYPVYARLLAAARMPPAGSYHDTVTVTLAF
ncbi:MAG: Csu type fimbrial protein [Pseudomonas piscis]|uniref:Csu type fimbrial protein n=1 Tax=Pseudomonas piscis TaxID=2614538 RepID=UPI003D298CE2